MIRTIAAASLLLLGALGSAPARAQGTWNWGAVGTGTAPFLGLVATGSKLADNYAAGYTWACSSSTHVMRASAPQGVIVLGNYWLKKGAGEQPIPGTTTWKAAIAYNGTLTPVTFGGGQPTISFTGTSAVPVANLFSDKVKLPPIGARFRVLILEQNPVGVANTFISNTQAPAELLVSGNSSSPVQDCTTTDLTSTGFPTGANTPVAIIAPTNIASASIVGDSRIRSLYGALDANGAGGELQPFVESMHPSIVMAASGDTAGGTLQNFTMRQQLFKFTTFMIDELCVNDFITTSVTPAACMGYRAQIAAMFPTSQVYGTTLAPNTTSTDNNWANAANQAVTSIEPNRTAFNALARAVPAFDTDEIDIDQALDPNGTGLWPTNGTAKFYTPDGLHETAAANLLIKRSNVWNGISFGRR